MFPSPKFSKTSTGYLFQWQEFPVEISLQRLRENSRFEIAGDIEVKHGEELLESTRINLSGAAARNSLAKLLTERVNSIDWSSALKYCAILSIRSFREGKPSVKLYDIPVKPLARYRLTPLLLENEANALWGDGDSGKSMLACFFAVLVQHGKVWEDLEPLQGNVLYLDWETSEDTVKERVNAIRKGLGITPPKKGEADIRYKRCERPLVEMVNEIIEEILKYDIAFVISDSVNKACAGEPEKLEFVKEYYNAARALERTTLHIDHISRGSDGKSPFGSVEKRNAPRQGFYQKAVQKEGQHLLTVGLFHMKHNVVPKLKERGWDFEFLMDELALDEVRVSDHDVSKDASFAGGWTHRKQIFNILQGGSMTPQDIAGALDISIGIVRVELNRNKKLFVRAGEAGEWGLLLQEDEQQS